MQDLAAYLLDPAVFFFFVLALLALFLLLFGLWARQSLRLSRWEKKYRRLLGQAPAGNLEEILQSVHGELAAVKAEFSRVDRNQKALIEKIRTSLRGVRLLRYNAFHDTGSDLSYSLALLDENRDGVVLSALYGRDECRTYAKPIKGGGSPYHLSEEESRVLRQAVEDLQRGGGSLV